MANTTFSEHLFNKATGSIPGTSYGESWDGSSNCTEWRKISVLSNGTASTWCKNTEPFWIMFPQGGTFTFTKVGSNITSCQLMIYTKDSSGNLVAYSPITATTGGTETNYLDANTKYYLIKSGTTTWATSNSAYHKIVVAYSSATIGGDIRSVVLNTTSLSAGTVSDIASVTNYYSSTTNFYAPYMFIGATGIVDASRLEFPENDYYANNACCGMFSGCTGLALPPIELPATISKNYMYRYMFDGCSSLRKTPIIYLPTYSGSSCMQYMFRNCSKLGRVYIKSTTWSTSAAKNWLHYAGGSATDGRHFYITSGVTPARSVSGCPSSFTLHNTTSDNINTIFPY